MNINRDKLRRIVRAVTLILFDRIDCEPRTDPLAPYMDWDSSLPENHNATSGWPVIVEPINANQERVWWGPGTHQTYVRYTPQQLEREYGIRPRSAGAPATGLPTT